MTAHDQVVDWLKKHGHRPVKPVTLTVGGEEFVGARYAKPANHGIRYYFLGLMPKCRRKRESLCFTHRGRVLYVAAYYTKPAVTEYAPYGPGFVLAIWDEVKNGPIDLGEPHPYHRVPVEIKSHKPKAKAK